MAWSTARAAARDALTKWTKIVWVGSKYDTRSALPGYAEDPDLEKVPPFERLVELAFGAHGVMRRMGLRPDGFWRWRRFTKARAGPRRRRSAE
jgi:hypothetical protein